MRTSILVAAPAFCAALHAQCTQLSMPPFAGAPVFLSLDRVTAPANAPTDLMQCGGFTATPPATWTAAGVPDFDLDRAFRNLLTPSCSVPRDAPLPDVDAISIGMDWVLADDAGRVLVPADRWGALAFTVAHDAQGAPGSPVNLEARQPEGAGLDVFEYVLPGSALPAHLVRSPAPPSDRGRVHRMNDAAELGLPRRQMTIDGLDLFIPLYHADPVLRGTGLVSPAPTLYFSVSNRSIAAGHVPSSWWAGTPPSGATILQMTWNPQARKWDCVRPWRLFASMRQFPYPGLGLERCEDIDGLAVDLARGRLLLSTARNSGSCPNRNQILFLSLAADGDPLPVPYTTPDGTPVTTASGLLGSDDVKAICSLDPIAPLRQSAGGGPNPIRVTIGTPSRTLTFPGIAHALEGTAFLECWPGAGPARVRGHGLGWPAAPGPGLAAVFLSVPGAMVPPVFVAAFPRNPNPAFCGDPQALTLPVPDHLRFLFPAFRFELTWIAADSASLHIGQAYPVGFDL